MPAGGRRSTGTGCLGSKKESKKLSKCLCHPSSLKHLKDEKFKDCKSPMVQVFNPAVWLGFTDILLEKKGRVHSYYYKSSECEIHTEHNG